jgi:hypothetical protein
MHGDIKVQYTVHAASREAARVESHRLSLLGNSSGSSVSSDDHHTDASQRNNINNNTLNSAKLGTNGVSPPSFL